MLEIESRYVIRVHLDLKFQILYFYQNPTLRYKNNRLDFYENAFEPVVKNGRVFAKVLI